MELTAVCRACGKKNYVFCNLSHEVIYKLLKFVPGLIELEAQKLPPDICIDCFQMIKTLVFNIEGIADMQKILKIRFGATNSVLVTERENNKRSLVEDMEKKYTSIKIRKITTVPSNELPPPPLRPPASPTKIQKIVQEKPKSVPLRNDKFEIQKSFMCISCSEKFSKFGELESHLRICKKNNTQEFKCFCGKVLKTKADLSIHLEVAHKKTNAVQHMCTICKKIFSSLSNLQNHVTMIHKSPHGKVKGNYMCHVCDVTFTDLQNLQKHRNSSACKPVAKKQIES